MEIKIQKLWDNEAEKVLKGKNDPFSAATLLDNMEEYARFRTKVEMQHLYSISEFKGKSLLDIGCGPGRLSFLFAKYCSYVLGIDISETFLSIAKQIKDIKRISNIDFKNMSITNINLDQKFDIIFIGGVLLYFDDMEVVRCIREIKNHYLNKNGRIIIREPISYLGRDFKDEQDVKRTEKSIEKLFKLAQMKTIYSKETFMHCPFYRFYKSIPPQNRNKWLYKYTFRFLFAINSLVDPLFLSFNPAYQKIVSKNWTVKQKFMIFQTES